MSEKARHQLAAFMTNITNADLEVQFRPEKNRADSRYKEPDYAYMHRELAKSGVNLTLLWSEYCTECYSNGDTPYMYTQFCDKYRHWARLTKATMRLKHKPGDVMQVDWAGQTIPIYDQRAEKSCICFLWQFCLQLLCICRSLFRYAI